MKSSGFESPAEKVGSAILRRYQKEKLSLSQSDIALSTSKDSSHKSRKGKENKGGKSSYDGEPSFYEAMADGSRLAMQYSTSKRLGRGQHDSAVMLDMSLAQEDDTIDVVRTVMSELHSLSEVDDVGSHPLASQLPHLVAMLKVIPSIIQTDQTGFET